MLPNVSYPQTQALAIAGTCASGFKGQTSRTCERSVTVKRVWGEIAGACERKKTPSTTHSTPFLYHFIYFYAALSPLEELASSWTMLFLPLVPFLVVALVTVLFHLSPDSRVTRVAFALAHWVYFGGVLASNVSFIVALFPFDTTTPAVAIALLAFALGSNFCYALFLVARPAGYRTGDLVVLPLSFFSLALFHAADTEAERRVEVDVFSLSNGFLQCAPLLLMQGLSLHLYAPIESLVAMAFNVLGLVLLLLVEGLWWCSRRGAQTKREHAPSPLDMFFSSGSATTPSSLKTPLLDSTLDGGSETLVQAGSADREQEGGRFFRPLLVLAFPLVALSFLPQVISLLGVPFALACVRRLLLASPGAKDPDPAPAGGNSRWRGAFLLSLNCVSFLLVLLVLLPGITVVGLTLSCYDKIQAFFSNQKSQVSADFRHAIQRLVSVLAFCYLCFLPQPPELRFQTYSSHETLARWKVLLAILFFLGLEVALPIADLVTSIQYAILLLSLSHDPLLTDQPVLVIWTGLSFAATAIGFVLGGARFLLLVWPLLRRPGIESAAEVVVQGSPFSRPGASTWQSSVLKFFHAVLKNLLQLMVTVNTIGFVGRVNPLWTLKLALSLLSAAYTLSSLLNDFVFGKKLKRLARSGLQFVYLVFCLGFLGLLVALSLRDRFCELDRTVSEYYVFEQIAECTTLTGELVFTWSETSDQPHHLVVSSISASLEVVNNTLPGDMVFASAVEISSSVVVSGNSADLNLAFLSLERVVSPGVLTVEANTGFLNLSVPVLSAIDQGASLIIKNNHGDAAMHFSSLVSVTGFVDLWGNSFGEITFPILSEVWGVLRVVQQPVTLLVFPTLSSVVGTLAISGNPNLVVLDLTQLLGSAGIILVDSNPKIQVCDFPLINNVDLNVMVTSNPSLRRVGFASMVFFAGHIDLQNNTALTDISFPVLNGMTVDSYITINACPSLVTLDFTRLNCAAVFTIYLLNNPALTAVYLPDSGCIRQIVNQNNPLINFVYP